jgi:hypothetical protein
LDLAVCWLIVILSEAYPSSSWSSAGRGDRTGEIGLQPTMDKAKDSTAKTGILIFIIKA